MKYTICTRSRSNELYNLASSFWGENLTKRYVNYNNYEDALYYLLDILNEPTEYVVNIDEDCFIHKFSEVEKLIEVMERESYAYCGMPDTQSNSLHRNNSPIVHNPFFNIFDTKQCLQVVNSIKLNPSDRIDGCQMHEPFNCLFKALSDNLSKLNLKGFEHEDGISTNLNNFALHSWYSREFEGEHRQRILRLYNEANNLRSIS